MLKRAADTTVIAFESKGYIHEVRAQEAGYLKAKGFNVVLTKTRWLLLKRPEKLTDRKAGNRAGNWVPAR